jgi:hypothetical protein
VFSRPSVLARSGDRDSRCSPEQLANMYDAHAPALFIIAYVLLPDRNQAESATAQAFDDACHAPLRKVREVGRRELAKYLYARCCVASSPTGPEDDGVEAGKAQTSEDSPIAILQALPRQQRSVLALSLYGRLTYREIADLTRQPAPQVAGMLRSGLHAVS